MRYARLPPHPRRRCPSPPPPTRAHIEISQPSTPFPVVSSCALEWRTRCGSHSVWYLFSSVGQGRTRANHRRTHDTSIACAQPAPPLKTDRRRLEGAREGGRAGGVWERRRGRGTARAGCRGAAQVWASGSGDDGVDGRKGGGVHCPLTLQECPPPHCPAAKLVWCRGS